MAKYNSLGELFADIANAIRAKTGSTDPIVAEDFPEVIDEMKSGGEIEALTVLENGTYTPPEGVDGYAPVTVNVVPPASDIDELITRLIQNIDSGTTRVGDNAFETCDRLVTANFPNATYFGGRAFANCKKLQTIYAPQVSSMGGSCFFQCAVLREANFPNLTSFGHSSNTSMFTTCTSLVKVSLPKVTEIRNACFSMCINLPRLDFPMVTYISTKAFNDCRSLKILALRSGDICTLQNVDAFNYCYHFRGTVDATYNPDGLKDGYIYVPRALIEDYKVATNWVTFADQFRALEDYTVDGTTTGELDESKVNA